MRVADGRAEFANDADVQAVEILDQPVVIQRQRAGEIRHARKTPPARCDRSGRLRMKSSSTACAMSKRDTRSPGPPMSSAIMDHDRSSTSMMSTPLACGFGAIVGEARPGQRDDAERHRQQSQEQQQPSRRRARRARRRPAQCPRWKIAAPRACRRARAETHKPAAAPATPAATDIEIRNSPVMRMASRFCAAAPPQLRAARFGAARPVRSACAAASGRTGRRPAQTSAHRSDAENRRRRRRAPDPIFMAGDGRQNSVVVNSPGGSANAATK